MKFGFNETVITPQVPVDLGGYGDRKGPATGVHDHLKCRSWVFSDGQEVFAWSILDLLAVPDEFVEEVRKQASLLTGIDGSAIMVSSIHTHSGPMLRDSFGMGNADPAYVAWVAKAAAGSIYMAWQDAKSSPEADLRAGSFSLQHVASNRENPEKPADTTATWLRTNRGGSLGVILNFACHPTVMSPANLLISADLPGGVYRALRRIAGECLMFSFVNGAAGDVSTRFTRHAQNFQEVERLGSLAACQAWISMESSESSTLSGPVKIISAQVTLPNKKVPPAHELDSRIEEYQRRLDELTAQNAPHGVWRKAKTALEGALREKHLAKVITSPTTIATVTAARIGSLGIVGIPGELFSSYGLEIRRRSPFKYTMISGYTNGYVGYIADAEAYEQGWYEALSSPLDPSAGSIIVESAVELLQSLAD